MKKTLVAATAACAVLAGGGAAVATGFNPFSEDAKTTAGTQLTSTVDGQLAGPGAAYCGKLPGYSREPDHVVGCDDGDVAGG